MSETQSDYNLDYDEYEQMEAEAEQLARNPNAVIPPAAGAKTGQKKQAQAAVKAPAQPVQRSEEEELAELEADSTSTDEEVNQMERLEKTPKWVPYHQPEKIGIINTETREVLDGFKDEGTATGMAKILNEIDAIIVGGGYQ